MTTKESLDALGTDNGETQKVIRLVDYLTRLASLRTKIIRDIDECQNVLWVKDIPRQKGCFTQAWGRDEEYDADVWIEIQTRREPEFPSVPPVCKEWVEKSSLRNKSALPKLLHEITKQIDNPDWSEESDQSEFILHTERHKEIRPLCISLLGSGLEERRSLESSVGGILRKNEEWNEDRAQRERENLEGQLCQLRVEKAKVDRRLRDIRESETHSHSIAEGTYRGTAARIAEAVNRD